MKRSDFLKSLAVLISAPMLLKDVAALLVPTGNFNIYWFKITKEMLNDLSYMECLINDPKSFVWRNSKKAGIDIDKPFEYEIGVNNKDDFQRNLITCQIRQAA